MATEQELAAANARIAQLERVEGERAKTECVARELARYDLASPAALQQLTALISPTVQVTRLSDGRDLVHDGQYKPLPDVIAERMRQPDHAHFLKATQSQAAASPAAGAQPVAPAVPTAQPLPPGQTLGAVLGVAARLEPIAGESLGAAMVRAAQAQRAVQGDPRLDPSQPLGIGRRGR